MSVLLRQPHGFEGFSCVAEPAKTGGLALGNSPDVALSRFRFDPTAGPSPKLLCDHDHIVTGIDVALDFETHVWEDFEGLAEIVPADSCACSMAFGGLTYSRSRWMNGAAERLVAQAS